MKEYPGKSLNSNRTEKKLQTQILHKELETAVTSRCKEILQYLRSHQHENRKKQAFFSACPNSLQYSTGTTRWAYIKVNTGSVYTLFKCLRELWSQITSVHFLFPAVTDQVLKSYDLTIQAANIFTDINILNIKAVQRKKKKKKGNGGKEMEIHT